MLINELGLIGLVGKFSWLSYPTLDRITIQWWYIRMHFFVNIIIDISSNLDINIIVILYKFLVGCIILICLAIFTSFFIFLCIFTLTPFLRRGVRDPRSLTKFARKGLFKKLKWDWKSFVKWEWKMLRWRLFGLVLRTKLLFLLL